MRRIEKEYRMIKTIPAWYWRDEPSTSMEDIVRMTMTNVGHELAKTLMDDCFDYIEIKMEISLLRKNKED